MVQFWTSMMSLMTLGLPRLDALQCPWGCGGRSRRTSRIRTADRDSGFTSCILLTENLWPELASRERLHGEQACAEVLGRQAPLAVEPAQKILSRKVLLPGVAIQAAGDEVAVRVASRLRDRHHMIQAVGPAG